MLDAGTRTSTDYTFKGFHIRGMHYIQDSRLRLEPPALEKRSHPCLPLLSPLTDCSPLELSCLSEMK